MSGDQTSHNLYVDDEEYGVYAEETLPIAAGNGILCHESQLIVESDRVKIVQRTEDELNSVTLSRQLWERMADRYEEIENNAE